MLRSLETNCVACVISTSAGNMTEAADKEGSEKYEASTLMVLWLRNALSRANTISASNQSS